MASSFKVDTSRPVNLAGSDSAAVVTNGATSGTLYVGPPTVSAGSNTYSIAAGASRVVQGPAWGIASTAIPVSVNELTVLPRTGNPSTRFWTGDQPAGINKGTSTAMTAATVYLGQVSIRNRCVLTGIRYGIGTTGGTDLIVAALYDNAGNPLAWSAIAGTTCGTGDTFQALPFTAAYEVLVPGKYFIGIVGNGTTATLDTHDDSAGQLAATGQFGGTSAAGWTAASAPVAVTAPTAVGKVPVAHVY